MATKILVSAYNAGWSIRVGGKTVAAAQTRETDDMNPNARVLRSLMAALTKAKVMCDHGVLVVELDNAFVYKGLVDDDDSTPEFMKVATMIDSCDAKIKFKLVKKAQARTAVKYGVKKPAKVEVESIESAFADLD